MPQVVGEDLSLRHPRLPAQGFHIVPNVAAVQRPPVSSARGRRNERLLLVMEAICATGIRVSELRFFTVEAVRLGRAEVTNKGKTRTVFLPGKLQKALLHVDSCHA